VESEAELLEAGCSNPKADEAPITWLHHNLSRFLDENCSSIKTYFATLWYQGKTRAEGDMFELSRRCSNELKYSLAGICDVTCMTTNQPVTYSGRCLGT
jgi:hypothetical protein